MLPALAEDLDLVLASVLSGSQSPATLSPGDLTPFPGLQEH